MSTLQERFDTEFANHGFLPESREQFLRFIQSEIEEAEKREREMIKNECMRYLKGMQYSPEMPDFFSWDSLEIVKNLISSL